jgi:uncharacterized membrane protein
LVSWSHLSFFLIVALSWYIHVAGGIAFSTIVKIGEYVLTNFLIDFLNPLTRDPLIRYASRLEPAPSLGYEIGRFWTLFTQLFIVLGVVRIFRSRKGKPSHWHYLVISLPAFILLIASVAIPYLAMQLNITRIYHLSLLCLAPCCVLGGEAVLTRLLNLRRGGFKVSNAPIQRKAMLLLLFLVLIPYFLFQSGFMYEISGDIPLSPSLSFNRMRNMPFNHYTFEQDVYSAEWLKQNIKGTFRVYADFVSRNRVLTSYGMIPREWVYTFREDATMFPSGALIYLSRLNLKNHLFVTLDPKVFGGWIFHDATVLFPLLDMENLVYSNGDSRIYYGV